MSIWFFIEQTCPSPPKLTWFLDDWLFAFNTQYFYFYFQEWAQRMIYWIVFSPKLTVSKHKLHHLLPLKYLLSTYSALFLERGNHFIYIRRLFWKYFSFIFVSRVEKENEKPTKSEEPVRKVEETHYIPPKLHSYIAFICRLAEVDPEEKKQERLDKFFKNEVVWEEVFCLPLGKYQKVKSSHSQGKRTNLGRSNISFRILSFLSCHFLTVHTKRLEWVWFPFIRWQSRSWSYDWNSCQSISSALSLIHQGSSGWE